MVIYILVIILLVGCLIYLWQWLNGDSDVQDMVIYSSPSEGLPAKSDTPFVYSGTQVPQIYPGGEYSISTWIYVTNWTVNKGFNKPFLVLSGGGGNYMTLVMYLGQFTNKLGVRLSYETVNANDGLLMTSGSSPVYPQLVAAKYGYADSDMKKCDIESVDIQRWVNISVVIMGKTVDVYIDGKLSRSSVLDGLFKADGDKPTLKLGGPNGFGGLIGKTRAANVAYSPDKIYSYYQEGPFTGFSLASLNPGQYSLDLRRNNSIVFTTRSSEDLNSVRSG